MAWWDGLLGGGGSSDPLDVYGDLFSEKQKAALAQRSAGEGLLRMAGAFGKAAQPSRLPTSFMGSLGEAAGALAGSGDQAAETALKAMKIGEDVRSSRQQREWVAKVLPTLLAELEVKNGLPQGSLTSQVPGASPAPPGAPVPPASEPLPPDSAPQQPGAPLNALGMPQPRNNTAFGIPQRPGQPPLTPQEAAGTPSLSTAGMGQRGGLPPDQKYNSQGQPISPDLTTNFPGQGSGAALPPGIRIPALPAAPPPAGQQNTGLLPPPDQVVGPDGQPLQGPGVLPTMAASYGGMPGGGLPFTRASSPPTPSAAGGPRGKAIDYFTKRGWTREQAVGIAANLEVESSWRKDVPGDGGQAFGYAQWHPPRQENFKRVFGKDIRNATEEEQLAFVNWELNNTEKAAGDRLRNATNHRDAAAIVSKYYERPKDTEGEAARRGALAEQIQGGGDYVIPSGRGVPRSALQNVADTGGGGDGGGPGGIDDRAHRLSTLSAITQLLGLKDPFGAMLDTHYKSPGYIAEIERTRAQAGKEVDIKMDPLIVEQKKRAEYKVDMELKPELDAAVARLQSPILKERAQAQADIDRVTKQMEQTGAAALRPNDVTVLGPDGVPVTQKLTDLELARRQQDRANRMAKGDMTPKPGDIVGTPVLSPEETAAQTQRGKTAQETREVDVWTPAGTVKQTMSNQEIWAREALAAQRGGGGGAPQIGDIVNKPAMTPADQKIADSLGEEFIVLRKQAYAADKTIRDTHNLRSKLDSGMFTGLDANLNLFLARLGDTMGWKNLSDPEKVKNTETYIAGLGSEVLSMVSALRPASNVDLDFARSMAGGQNLSAASIRQLLDMREEYARLAIQRHNEEAAGRNPAIFQGARRELPMPPEYQPKELTTPSGNKVRINR